MAAGTRGVAVPIRFKSSSSRPGWVPRIMAPAPGIGPSRDWVDPGVRVAAPEICVVSIVGDWPPPVREEKQPESGPEDQSFPDSAHRSTGLLRPAFTEGRCFPKVLRSGASSRFGQELVSRFYRINSK